MTVQNTGHLGTSTQDSDPDRCGNAAGCAGEENTPFIQLYVRMYCSALTCCWKPIKPETTDFFPLISRYTVNGKGLASL